MEPTRILQIYRERLKPGSLAAYSRIEERAARMCRQLKCPHPYLAMEAMKGAKEVWFLNGYASEAERGQVARQYQENTLLVAALSQFAQLKTGVALPPIETVARLHNDLNTAPPWMLGSGRFLVISQRRGARGTEFQVSNGKPMFVVPARTEEAARNIADESDQIFAVRPQWSVASPHWVNSDPAFWTTLPLL